MRVFESMRKSRVFLAMGLLLLMLAAGARAATEQRGIVKFNGLPVPGVTVTASQGDKKVAAVTDDQGIFSFADLANGSWSLDIEMPGFTKVQQAITVGAGEAQSPAFDLKML